MRQATQLARVQTPTPRLLALTNTNTINTTNITNTNATNNNVRVVVQIRPTLLHYVQDGVLMCVITSREEICGVAQGAGPTDIVVATTSGRVWRVQLPLMPMGVKPLVLKASSPSNTAVKCIATVPGAQQLAYHADVDILVCTSLLVPTTILCGVLQGPQRFTLELDGLEGERSTSLCVLSSANHARLAAALVGPTPPSATSVVIVQGDVDGVARCAIVDVESNGKVERVMELARLREPIHSFVPVRVETGADTDALLVVGTRGSVIVLAQGRTLFGSLGTSIASVAFVDGDNPMIAVSTSAGKVCTLSVAKLLKEIEATNSNTSTESKSIATKATEMSSYQDALLVASDNHSTTVSLLSRSGRLVSLLRDEVIKPSSSSAVEDILPTDQRVKKLLLDIGRLSEESKRLQEASDRADVLLRGFNTAVSFVRLVEDHGIDNVVTCSLRLRLVDHGWAMQSKGVQLVCRIQFTDLQSPAQLAASAMWRLQLTVGTTRSACASSYGFPLHDCVEKERSVQLDESVLQHVDGVVRISCDLVFAPQLTAHEATDSGRGDGVEQHASFGIPVVQAREAHLVQLCEPATDFPMNPVAVRDKFNQAHAVGSRQGYQWWSTLFEDSASAGVALSANNGDELVDGPAPPLRLVVRISSGQQTTSERGSATTQEDTLAMFYRLMNVEGNAECERWRSACRQGYGKWWFGLRTFSGNLIVLRFAPAKERAEGEPDEDSIQQCVEITAYASNTADLSAIRALILDSAIARPTMNQWKKHNLERASVALTETRAELNRLAVMISDINHKVLSSTISGKRESDEETVDICQDELLQLFRRTAQVETRTLELYWKSREVLSQHLML